MRKKYKTKFPVARIKKIMQMDEDVGKVAQATPILISKALELFMQSLIDEACMETRSKNAKRLTAAHLKKTILDKDQFDFLRDIVANVPDPQGGTGASASAGGVSGSGDAEDGNHSSSNASGSGSGSGGHHKHSNSNSNNHNNNNNHNSSSSSSSSNSTSLKKEEADPYAASAMDFASAMAAAKKGAPSKPVAASRNRG
ncbi:hypothetical protein BG011_006170 [Mortierella polycephala]|uniref:Transcription factor CBF/NF-Y/archaeal histone domain-containing protein n=1 Tax=Mortierella polycephala TaxID=41804 RepID=A0A9P6QCE0_9FUNG|nr:hypothetical protein BG011_006170 [Mortierella polycephala]